jgi:NADPH:quinone reductase-like Zn-dependent oxidoreductase
VLVLAGGSGVGQAAIQIARAFGARVLATSGPAKLARTLGARRRAVFDHYAGDFLARVREATGGRGADVVIEHVGEATWERSVRSLARGGRLVTCGATTGPRGAIDLRHLFARQLSLLGSYMGRKSELRRCGAAASSTARCGPSWTTCCRCRPRPRRTGVSSPASTSGRSSC